MVEMPMVGLLRVSDAALFVLLSVRLLKVSDVVVFGLLKVSDAALSIQHMHVNADTIFERVCVSE